MTYPDVLKIYKPTIGIECHVQLNTKTKLFSGADNNATDKKPNTVVSPVCFGFPGVLPILNKAALEKAVRAGLAMNATIPRLSRFERKHYLYPDLPKGYQITQLAEPVIVGGQIDVPQLDGSSRVVRIHHTHLEEDAGKLTHPEGADYSLVDLNRAGTPLIEIVSEPDIHSPGEARAYAQELYLLMTYAGITDGDLYHGNMRFDVNVSLAPLDDGDLGTRTETKNLNSFKSVEKAAEYECVRQAEELDNGRTITQETRGWDEAKQKTVSQRSKESAHDYRYMPDPDIPPVIIESETVEQIRNDLAVLPFAYRKHWQSMQLDSSVVNSLLSVPLRAKIVTSIQNEAGDSTAKRVAHWFASAVYEDIDLDSQSLIPTAHFIDLAALVENNSLSSTGAKDVFVTMLRTGEGPENVAVSLGVLQTNDQTELEAVVEQILRDPSAAKAIDDIAGGNDKAIGFLVGLAMKASSGKANPATIQDMIRKRLDK